MSAHDRLKVEAEPIQGARVQFAALPYRFEAGELRVLLLTSRETGRWVVPKGWPIPGKKPHRSAAREALEEAGIEGEVGKKPLGAFVYWKRLAGKFVLCHVWLFPLAVQNQRAEWREKGQRELRWVSPTEATELVDEPGLADLILTFANRHVSPDLKASADRAASSRKQRLAV